MFERRIRFDEDKGCYFFIYPEPENPAERLRLIGKFSDAESWEIGRKIDFSHTEDPVACGRLPYTDIFSYGPDTISTALSISTKSGGSNVFRLPRCLSFCASATLLALDNFYQEFGAEVFFASKLTTTISRGDVSPNSQLRPEFGHWHDHRREDLDIIYACSDLLPTEFLKTGKELETPTSCVIRFNKNTLHRSPTNKDKKSIRRTWWSLQTRLEPKLKNELSEDLVLKAFGNPRDYPDISDRLRFFHSDHGRPQPVERLDFG